MRHHPVLPRARRHPFGFDAVMGRSQNGRFRRWYDQASLLPPGRAAVAGLFSAPDGPSDDAA